MRKQTDETILRIERDSRSTVTVSTGIIVPGRMEGAGHTYTLIRTDEGWEIDDEHLWLSPGRSEDAGSSERRP